MGLGELEEKGVVWVGHNSLTVEKKIIEEQLEVKRPIPIERMEDMMLRHFSTGSGRRGST